MYVYLFFYEHKNKNNCASIGCPNKSTRFKVHAIVILLGWRHWNFNICHLSFLRLVVMERYTKEQRVIIVKNLLQNYTFHSYWDTPYFVISMWQLYAICGVCVVECLCGDINSHFVSVD